MISRIAFSLATILIGAGIAAAEPQWRVLAQFDDAPEGVLADDRGNLYTTLFHNGRIVRIPTIKPAAIPPPPAPPERSS